MRASGKTLSAGRWTAASAAARLFIQLAQTVVLARLLGPEAFGAMAIVAGFLAILGMLSDLGLGKALIHFGSLSKGHLSNLFWCALAVSFGISLLFALCAPLIAHWFNDPGLTGIVVVGSAIFPIAAVGQQIRALAEKELRFKELALSEITAAACGLLVGIVLALRNAGPYALLGAVLTGAVVNSGFAWLLLRDGWWPSRWIPGLSLGRYLRYGAYLMGDGLTSTARMQADILIAGAIANPAAVGFYTVTRDLSLKIANSLVNPIITRISLPLMAQIQSDRERLKRAYLSSIQVVSFINFPIYLALGLYAPEVVEILYGVAWLEAAKFLRIFAIWGLIRCVGNPSGSLLYAAGYARLAFTWNFRFLIFVPPLLVLGAMLDKLTGVAWAMLLTQVLFFMVTWKVFVERACGASLSEYLGSMGPALLAALLAAGCATLATLHIEGSQWRLLVGGLAGSLAYVAFSALINRQTSKLLMQMLPVRQRGQS